jgi:hypothetical protein
MSALGELPRLDAAIHADTTHEKLSTYTFSKKWTPWLEDHDIRVVTVVAEKTDPIENGHGRSDLPLYTNSPDGGLLSRQCTRAWKIRPQSKWISQELRRIGIKKSQGVVTQWFGISWDELERIKPSTVKYIANEWPLIDRRMTRQDCVKWLQAHDLEVPQKSACVFCPYQSRLSWHDLKAQNGKEWETALEVDRAIRHQRAKFDLFLHRDRKPLEEVDMRTEQENGQLELFDSCESGYCWL